MKRRSNDLRWWVYPLLCSIIIVTASCDIVDSDDESTMLPSSMKSETKDALLKKVNALILKPQLKGKDILNDLGEPDDVVDGLPSGLLYHAEDGAFYLFEVEFPETGESPFGLPIKEKLIIAIYYFSTPTDLSKKVKIWPQLKRQ